MRAEELREFRELLEGALAFWGQSVSEFALSVWWQAMQPYGLAAVRQAFSRHAMNPDNGQFAPKPADIVRMLGGTSSDQALQAWAKVDRAVRHIGTYQSVAFDDALIHRVMQDMGGWIALGMKTEDEWPFVAREFENRYRGDAMRGERPDYPPTLIGLAEAHNAKEGFKSVGPILIGDAERAQKVMLGGTNKPAISFTPVSAIEQKATLKLVQAQDKTA